MKNSVSAAFNTIFGVPIVLLTKNPISNAHTTYSSPQAFKFTWDASIYANTATIKTTGKPRANSLTDFPIKWIPIENNIQRTIPKIINDGIKLYGLMLLSDLAESSIPFNSYQVFISSSAFIFKSSSL